MNLPPVGSNIINENENKVITNNQKFKINNDKEVKTNTVGGNLIASKPSQDDGLNLDDDNKTLNKRNSIDLSNVVSNDGEKKPVLKATWNTRLIVSRFFSIFQKKDSKSQNDNKLQNESELKIDKQLSGSKLKNTMNEVMTTEKTFQDGLKKGTFQIERLIRRENSKLKFMLNKKHLQFFTECKECFSSLNEESEKLSKDLENLFDSEENKEISDGFDEKLKNILEKHSTYFELLEKGMELKIKYDSTSTNDKNFDKKIKNAQLPNSPLFSNIIVTPMQRLGRFEMFFNQLKAKDSTDFVHKKMTEIDKHLETIS